MRNHIGRVFERLLNLLLPVPGQHRAAGVNRVAVQVDTQPVRLRLPRARSPHAESPLNAEDDRLVRPYLVAHEQRMKRREESGCRAGSECASQRMAVTW
ncbi:hypothetical protein OG301_17445 [Streptomyces platensis]|uniref:hypothetical protein n=1 Tax=Streptomyces platensis TaxID=58346 RepID=UPI002ED1257E|nr:hypothetical protein OG301_17445 [Streptomyces platensis]